MPNPEQPKPIMTPEEQEKLDEFLAERKEQEQGIETQEQSEKATKKEFSEEESLEIIEQIEELLPEDDKLLKRWLETAKQAVSTEKGNLGFAAKELETLAIMLRTRAAKERNKKTKIKLQQAIALFGLLIAGYSTFSAEVTPTAKAVAAMTEKKDAFSNYINDFRNPGVSGDNLCAWISQNADEMTDLDYKHILIAVRERLQHCSDLNNIPELLKIINMLNEITNNSNKLIYIAPQLAQEIMDLMPGRSEEYWNIWLADDKNWTETNKALNFLSLYAESKTDSLPDIANLKVMEPVVRDALKRYDIENTTANRKKMIEIIDESWYDYEQRKVFGEDVAVIAIAGEGIKMNSDSMVEMANANANISKKTGEYPIYSFGGKSEPNYQQKTEILNSIRSCQKEQLTFWFDGHMLTLKDENNNPIERRLRLSKLPNKANLFEIDDATISADELASAFEARFRNNSNSKTTIMLSGCYSHIFTEKIYKILKEKGLSYLDMPVIISSSVPDIREGKSRNVFIDKQKERAISVLSSSLRKAMIQRNDRTSTKLLSLLKADEEAYKNQGESHSRFQIILPINLEKIKEKFPEADFGKEGEQKPPILEVGYLEQKESEFFYA